MELEQEDSPKTPSFVCTKCHFKTGNKKDFRRHESSLKHNKLLELNMIEQPITPNMHDFVCKNCKKAYQSRSGLWNHSKKCTHTTDDSVLTNSLIPVLDNATVYELIKQNQEFKELLIEQNKKLAELANEPRVINNNNNQNNQFNLNFFLNETCKDAITAEQFVENIKISFADLENIGNIGYIDGFTEIIMTQLKNLDITKRPFHCTDIKRETIYIKEADKWNKDDDSAKLKNVIGKVAHKSRSNVSKWQQCHPDVYVLDSNDYDMNHKILRNTWGDGETDKLQEKVVKNIAKEVHINKTTELGKMNNTKSNIEE